MWRLSRTSTDDAAKNELVGVHRLDGTPVEALLTPTSELPLHLAIYADTDALAAVHHHAVCIGKTLEQAYERALYLDWLCEVQLRAMSTGRPVKVLPDEEIAHVVRLVAGYGQSVPPT